MKRVTWVALGGIVALTCAAETDLAKASAEEAMRPILPGWGRYYWNQRSIWYIHPPAFDFTNVTGAVGYRFRVVDDAHRVNTFVADKPTEPLVSVWTNLPPKGLVTVFCEGVDADGRECGAAGRPRTFWKNPPFDPAKCPKGRRSYAEAAEKVYDYIFSLDCVRVLAETGNPDPRYRHNCYPTKMNARLINAALHYAERRPGSRERLVGVARAAADYLISVAEPEDAPLAGFTPTYEKGNANFAAGTYAGQNMLIHPAEAGDAFLRLHAVTKDAKYLAAARRIGDTYLRLQGEDGTWYLKMWERDGKPVNPNRLLPLGVCDFLVALERATGDRRYGVAADRAFTFIEKGPLADWNWEGQFEDVEPTARYENLTKHPACETALYLLRRYRGDARRLLQARELLRFAEDQFVAWERPCRADGTAVESPFLKGKRIAEWPVFPAVMEQYKWYVPIDASAAKLIRTYLALYAVARDPLDLAKARALGDSCTRIQEPTGCITTHWTSGSQKPVSPGKIRQADWLNCMIATAEALEELSQTEKED